MSEQLKKALVTGASSGIGAAIATQLKTLQYEVTGLSRSITESHSIDHAWQIDLADISSLEKQLADRSDAYDLLVLAAGTGRFASIEEFSYRQINQLVNTNLLANLYLCKHFIPMMKQQQFGDVVFIASEAGMAGARFSTVYSATKFALRGLAQSLRAECRNANIRIMSCFPGPVQTAFFDHLNFAPQGGREFSLQADDIASTIIHSLGQARHVVTEEIIIQPMKRSFSKTGADKKNKSTS